jgi:hypothetical protein
VKKRRMFRAWTCVAAVLCGCGGAAFSASTGGDAGISDDGAGMPPVEGGADGHDTGTPTGSDGGGPTEGSVIGDSGLAGEAEAGCGSFCALHTNALLCADFDQQAAMQPPSGWNVMASTGATVIVSDAQAESCDHSLLSELPVLPSTGGTAAATQQVHVTGTSPHVVVDLWVYLPAQDSTSFVTYFSQQLGSGSPIGLTHHGDSSWYLDSNPPCCVINQPLTTPPLVGAWNHMVLDVVYGTSGMASLAYEGSDMQAHVVTYTGGILIASGAAAATVSLGMVAPGTTEAGFSAYYDNVFVTNPP